MVRKFEKKRYVVAAIFTAIIFLFGMSIGMVVENKRVEYLNKVYQAQSNEYESLQLQYLYLTAISEGEESCPVLQYSFDLYMKHLEDTRVRLEKYQQESSMSKSDFNVLKRQYLLAEIKAWLFTRKVKEVCNDTNIVTILNFHAKNCEWCEAEGMILSYFKAVFKEKLLIFSFDLDYEEEPMVNILRKKYNINRFPTLIIEDEKYEGFMPTETLKHTLCANYGKVDECK